MTDLSLAATADTEDFAEQLDRATEALREFQSALDDLEETPVSVEIQSVGDRSVTKIETTGGALIDRDEVMAAIEENLRSNNTLEP